MMVVLGYLALIVGCGCTGLGLWWGWALAADHFTTKHRRELVIATQHAYDEGFVAGMGSWLTPAPPEQPYDIEADR